MHACFLPTREGNSMAVPLPGSNCIYMATFLLAPLGSAAPQVYTYLLRPLTAPGRHASGDYVSTQQRQQQLSGSLTSSDDQQQQQTATHASSGVPCGHQNSGSEAIVGYELQLVMEYCPLVSCWSAKTDSAQNVFFFATWSAAAVQV
jgi:hypothetical protein